MVFHSPGGGVKVGEPAGPKKAECPPGKPKAAERVGRVWAGRGEWGAASGVSGKVKGRRWLILKDRVDEVEKKIRFAHGIALASVGLTALWVVFAMLASQAQG